MLTAGKCQKIHQHRRHSRLTTSCTLSVDPKFCNWSCGHGLEHSPIFREQIGQLCFDIWESFHVLPPSYESCCWKLLSLKSVWTVFATDTSVVCIMECFQSTEFYFVAMLVFSRTKQKMHQTLHGKLSETWLVLVRWTRVAIPYYPFIPFKILLCSKYPSLNLTGRTWQEGQKETHFTDPVSQARAVGFVMGI